MDNRKPFTYRTLLEDMLNAYRDLADISKMSADDLLEDLRKQAELGSFGIAENASQYETSLMYHSERSKFVCSLERLLKAYDEEQEAIHG